MPSTRELMLILRAQDQASRVLNSFGRAARSAGNDARLAQLDAAKGSEAAALARNRLAQANLRNEVAELANENAMHRTQMAQAMLGGTTKAYLDSKRQMIIDNEREIQIRRDQIIGHQDEANAIRGNINDIDSQIAARRRAISAIEDHKAKMEDLSNKMQAVSRTAATLAVGFGVAGAAGLVMFASTIKSAQEYDRQVNMTATQITGFKANLGELGKVGLEVGRNIGVPLKEIQPMLYDIFSSMDVNMDQAKKLLTGFAKEAVAGQVSLQDAGRATISIMNAFHIPADDVNKVLDVQFQLVRKGVGTFKEFSTTIGRSIPSAVRAGQSVETLSAMLAFLTRNGLSAAMASASAGRAFDAMSNPNTVARLEAMGIKVRDTNGNFLPLVDTLQQLRDKLMEMPGPERLKAITDIFKGSGGTIQARRFLDQVLLKPGDLEQFKGLLGDMENATGAFSDSYAAMADTSASKTQKMKNSFEELKISVGNALLPIWNRLVDGISGVINSFNNLDPKVQRFIVYMGLAATAGSLFIGAVFGIVAVIAGIVGAFALAGISAGGVALILGGLTLGVGLLVLGFGGLVFALKNAYDKSEDFRSAVNRVKVDFWAYGQMVKRAWKDHIQPALDETAKIIKEKLKPAWDDFWSTVRDKVEPKIHEFIDWMRDNTDPVLAKIGKIIKEQINPALEDLAGWWKKNKEWVEPLLGLLIQATFYMLQLAAAITVISGLGGFELLALSLQLFAWWLDYVGTQIKFVKQHWEDLMLALSVGTGFAIAQAAGEWLITKIMELKQKWEEFKNWWESAPLSRAIGDEFGRIKTVVKNAFAEILGYFGLSFGDANAKTSKGMTDIGGSVGLGMAIVKSLFGIGWADSHATTRGGIANILATVTGLNTLRSLVGVAFDGARAGAGGPMNDLVADVGRLRERIRGVFANFSLWDVGKAMMEGLGAGINSHSGWVAGMAAGAARQAFSAAMGAINAKSPSRDFMKVGHYAMQGFGIGITEGMRQLTPTIKAQFGATPAMATRSIAPPVQTQPRNVSFNITVNQADRNARQLASDLGQELAGML